jgi:hypothetical protein
MVLESHGNVSFGKTKNSILKLYQPKNKSLTPLKHPQINPSTQNIQENVQKPEIKLV